MFRGRGAIRFCSDRPETAVVEAVRQNLGALGRVAIDPRGVIRIDPGESPRSTLAATALGGRMRERGMSMK